MSSLAYQFGGWLVEPELNRISSGSVERHLEPLTMDVLCHLLENAGQIVSSERVLATVWSGKIVESNAVPRAINQIREALGDDSRAPRYIETIRKRGYRTIVDVSRVGPEPAPETASWDSRPGGYDSGPSRATARRRFTRISVMLLGVGLAVGLLYIQRGAVVTNLILRFPALFFGEPIDQSIGFTETKDGVRIAYATSGVGEPIIHILTVGTHLESGQSSPIYDNDGLVALSSRNNLFVRYDGRGTGLSDRGVDDYALQARLSDLEAVIDTLGLQRFGVLAVSAGGQVAIAYTANHPERVTRLVLAGAVSNYKFDDNRFSNETFDLIEVGWHRPEVPRMFADLLLAPEGNEVQRRVLGEMLSRANSGDDLARFYRASNQIDVSDDARRISVPTLVIQARDDAIVPLEEGRRQASLIPNARLELVDGGHMASSASTAATRRLALEFLNQTDS